MIERIMKVHPSITPERIADVRHRGWGSHFFPGLCVACGCDVERIDRNAEKCLCDACGEHAVYSAERLSIMSRGNDMPEAREL